MGQEDRKRKRPQANEQDSRGTILTLEEGWKRKEQERRDAEPRYEDSKSALQAMKQYLKTHPPLPTIGSCESVGEHRARIRKYFQMRRMAEIENKRELDDAAESKRQAKDTDRSKAGSNGDAASGVVGGSPRGSGVKEHEEEEDGWVIIPTTIFKSKCRDGGLSQSESDDEYDEESDDDDEEDDVDEEECLRAIAGSAPPQSDMHTVS